MPDRLDSSTITRLRERAKLPTQGDRVALSVGELAALLDAAEAVQRLRERAQVEIADAKEGAAFASEIDNGMMLDHENARWLAWRVIAKLLSGPHAG